MKKICYTGLWSEILLTQENTKNFHKHRYFIGNAAGEISGRAVIKTD